MVSNNTENVEKTEKEQDKNTILDEKNIKDIE